MAANKFATMLHNNTNKITLILVYAVLEWALIILLLFNSVFSYLIIKFAKFFGLNPPCFWCARIDRLFESDNNSFHYNLCELHSKEVSHLGFCSIHQKLADSHNLCKDCSSSDLSSRRKSKNFVFSKVERIDAIQSDGEDEVNLKCSCCRMNFERKFADDSSCFMSHPLWDILGNVKKADSIDDHVEKFVVDDQVESDYVEETEKVDDNKELETEEAEIEVIRKLNTFEQDLIHFEKGEDLISHNRQFFIDYSGNQLFPFELLDSKTEEIRNDPEDEDHEFGDFQKAQMNSQEINDSVHQKSEESSNFSKKIRVSHENLIDFGNEQVNFDEQTQTPSIDTEELQQCDSDIHSVHEEEDEVSIGTEIPVLDSLDEIKPEEHSTDSNNWSSNLEKDFEEAREDENAGEFKKLSKSIDEIEEERAPDTPSSIHSVNPLHKKWLMPETKESGTEESFDGSTLSEIDAGDPVNTAEKLKSALKVKRQALQDLYSELEEERDASAVATNETLAMITRLQEEKAAMQMEALQYQRMMEEQSEYDQEALQLLNELMMKKEKELELYRKKVSDYEAKEKIRVLQRSSKTGTSSISWSHSEDDEGMSIDFNQVLKEEDNINGNEESRNQESQHHNHQNTPIGSVLDLESSLADFEEERVSILEHLKILEEKLLALSDEEERHFANVTLIEDHYEEISNYGFNGNVVEYTANGFAENGKQPMGKQLLSLFNANSTESEDGVTVRNGYETGFYSMKLEDTAVTRFELEKKRIDMEEEMDQLYARLQALEADRVFLKHCLGSMRKGDKGMELLQEILHYLRDLRDVNIRAKSYTENALL